MTMTREEAIEQLQYCKGLIKQNGQDYLDERDFPLLDMVIKALQAQPTHGRLIDADALIEDFNKLNEWLDIDEEAEIVSLINNAPTISTEAVSEDTQTKTELAHIKARLENVEKRLQGLANDVLIGRSRTG